ncbi:MAG: hypothetical protein IKU25_05625 [Clostridia bacterium]|nr:hypothetical protein [Clostridia bacterium]
MSNTFFVNTSKNKFISTKEILDILQETNELISIDCEMESWEDKSHGYASCVKKIGETIDNYYNVSNDFTLIVYVDLLEFPAYVNIPYSTECEQARDARAHVMHRMIRRYIRNTLYKGLVEQGRNPSKMLIIFDEYRKLSRVTANRNERVEEMMTVLGLPTEKDKACDMIDAFKANNEGVATDDESFKKKIFEFVTAGRTTVLGAEICKYYDDNIITWARNLFSGVLFEDACEKAFGSKQNDASVGDGAAVKSVAFTTDRRAAVVNQQLRVKREMMICVYLMDCALNGSIFDYSDEPKVRELENLDWEQLEAVFNAKLMAYKQNHRHALKISGKYSKLKLAPELMAMDNERFGLDEHGGAKTETKIVSNKNAVDDKNKEADDENQHGGDIAVKLDVEKQEVIEVAVDIKPPFKGFKSFEGKEAYVPTANLSVKSSPAQFDEEVVKLKRYHVDYLTRLKYQVDGTIANYAGKSADNTQEWLPKRVVNMTDADLLDDKGQYRYTHEGREKPEENAPEVAQDIADTSYKTLVREYLAFSASRCVALTDIEQQCSRFATKIEQIKKSLKKLWIAGVFMWIALIFVYAPFVISQWFDFMANPVTKLLFVGSFVLPGVLLYVIYFVLKKRQMRRCFEAWQKLLEDTNKQLARNVAAAKAYETLLSIKIPSLRAVYEHKLDVEFFRDCCDMATAKVKHHAQKMHDRVNAIGNIMQDLSMEFDNNASTHDVPMKIDYTVPFCVGEDNIKFYTVLDVSVIEAIKCQTKTKGGQIDGIIEIHY